MLKRFAKVTVNNRTIFQERLQIPCINKVKNIKDRESWMTLIFHYLKYRRLSNDKKKVRKVEC